MKKYLIWLLVMVLSLSVAFMGISCKTAAPAEEESAAEEESEAEEATILNTFSSFSFSFTFGINKYKCLNL